MSLWQKGKTNTAGFKRPHRSKRGNMRKIDPRHCRLCGDRGRRGLAAAQTYPLRPIMVIVRLATGGSTDLTWVKISK